MEARLADAVPETRLEECLLLWLLDAAVKVDLGRGASGDELRPLLVRRTELLDQLTAELTPLHLTPREFDDFNPFDESDEGPEDAIGLFEAAMLDLALSGERPDQPLVTLDEAERLHAGDEPRRRRIYTAVAVAVTALITTLAVVICILAEAPGRVTVGLAVALLAGGSALAVLAFLRKTDTRVSTQPIIVGLLLEVALGLFLLVEGILGKVIVGDEVAALIGIGALGLPPLVQAGVERLQK